MLSVFIGGVSELWEHALPLLVFFIVITGWGLAGLYPFVRAERPGNALALSLGVGIIVVSLWGLVITFLALFWPGVWVPASLILAGFSLVGFYLFRRDLREVFRLRSWTLWLGGFLLLALLVVRLSFLKSILLPPYHDSPEHYMLVQRLLSGNWKADVLLDSTELYYHLGFHSLTAWLVSATGLGTAPALALLGQVFIVICPFTLFALTGLLSKDRRLAWAVAVLAGIGWRMPAFAANWGKYPALAAVAVFPAVVALWLIVYRSRKWSLIRLALLFLFTAGLLLLHTRSLVLLGLAACSFGFARLVPLPKRIPLWGGGLLALVVLFILYLLREPVLNRYADPWLIVLGLLFLGLPFAFSSSPRLSAGAGLFLLGIYAASEVALPLPLKTYSRFLLDRPFVDVSLFLPLSVLVGAGIGGILSRFGARLLVQAGLAAAFAVLVCISFPMQGSLLPDSCCNYVHSGDLSALEWVKSETAPDAVVLISGFETRNYQMATDGGVWVRALTGRNMNKVPYDIRWDRPSARELVCKREWNEPYIYAGGEEFSFERDRLYQPEWYELVYESAGTRIYKVRNCRQEIP